MTNPKFTHLVVAVAVIAAGLFGADFIINGYDQELSGSQNAGQGSVLGVETGALDSAETEVVTGDLETGDSGTVAVEVSTTPLSEKTIFTTTVLADAGFSNSRIESLVQVEKLFGYFQITQLNGNALVKKAVYVNDEPLFYIYQFPAAGYALGLDYAKTAAQMKEQMTDNYTLHEPSSFGALSLYITANDPANTKITALAQLNGTLLGLEYDKADYPQLKQIIDIINSQNNG